MALLAALIRPSHILVYVPRVSFACRLAISPLYFKLWRCWLRSFALVTYLCMFLGSHLLAA
ncbi:hypothetical protein C9446_10470 [Providencia heimbachae]|nr:hypothetical protein C9446_10470 [Providencia heimbachae]